MVTVVENKMPFEEIMQKANRIGEVAVLESDCNSTTSPRIAEIIREEKIHRLILSKEFDYPQLDLLLHQLIQLKSLRNYYQTLIWKG
ncbi:hypothetical protein ACWV26_02735 [Rummeliibacillus sp. JY-2-4R]